MHYEAHLQTQTWIPNRIWKLTVGPNKNLKTTQLNIIINVNYVGVQNQDMSNLTSVGA
jgi:hypothetical protein